MTNTPGRSGYGQYGAPAGAHGWYAVGTDGPSDPSSSRAIRSLWVVVAVLGAATFAVSFGSSVATGFSVRLAVLAAAIAAVGLLPRQAGRGWIVVAFAVTGLLDALATWVAASASDWALPVIFVLNALQSLAAVGALLGESGALRSAPVGGQDYAAYASFAAAYQAYVAQYQQTPMPYYYAGGQASAQARAAAQASAYHSGVPADPGQASEAFRASYAQYSGYATAEGARGSSRGPSELPAADPGLPDAIRGAPQHQPPHVQREDSGRASSS